MHRTIAKTLFKSVIISLVFLSLATNKAWAQNNPTCGPGEIIFDDQRTILCDCIGGTPEEDSVGNQVCVYPEQCTEGQEISINQDIQCVCGNGMTEENGLCVTPLAATEVPPNSDTTNENSQVDFTSTVTKQDFNDFNPLLQGKAADSNKDQAQNAAALSTPGGIISRLLEYLFPLAGMVLFVMFTWSGFEMILGASNGSKSIEAGKNRLTTSIIGFILLFSSYWIIQILEVILGIKVF